MDGADSRQAMKRSSLWSGSPRKRAGGLDAAQHSTAQHSTAQHNAGLLAGQASDFWRCWVFTRRQRRRSRMRLGRESAVAFNACLLDRFESIERRTTEDDKKWEDKFEVLID